MIHFNQSNHCQFLFILTLDFLIALPVNKKSYNTLMSMTCKFSKRVILIESKNTFTVEDWAYTLLSRFDLVDWGLAKELITDQDPKFLNKF